METVDWATYQAMRQWRDYMRSWKNNSGTNSSAYKVRLELDLYDNAGAVVRTIVLVGAFPTAIGEVALDGAQSTVIDLNMTFSFDYIDDQNSF
jgi:hypothetical protein